MSNPNYWTHPTTCQLSNKGIWIILKSICNYILWKRTMRETVLTTLNPSRLINISEITNPNSNFYFSSHSTTSNSNVSFILYTTIQHSLDHYPTQSSHRPTYSTLFKQFTGFFSPQLVQLYTYCIHSLGNLQSLGSFGYVNFKSRTSHFYSMRIAYF